MTTSTSTTVYAAIPPAVLDQLRVLDDAGRPPVTSIDDEGGSPLRCCLRRAVPGERVSLVAYAPLRRWASSAGADPGPYDEQGPVFIHAEACAGPTGTSAAYPMGLHGPHRVFRTYSVDGHILGGRLVQTDSDATAGEIIDSLLTDPDVALVHARAVEFGCFLFEARRAH
jgi:hypothetical protein